MTSYNAIWIGYPFSQDFETDEGAIPDEVSLWLPLSDAGGGRKLHFSHIPLTRLSPTSWRMELTAEQTATLRPGDVSGDLRLHIGGTDTPLGVRITIPVEIAQ